MMAQKVKKAALGTAVVATAVAGVQGLAPAAYANSGLTCAVAAVPWGSVCEDVWGSGLYVDHIDLQIGFLNSRRYGHFNVFGPQGSKGWASDNFWAPAGDQNGDNNWAKRVWQTKSNLAAGLWCVQFIELKGDGTSAVSTGNACATVSP